MWFARQVLPINDQHGLQSTTVTALAAAADGGAARRYIELKAI